MRPHLLEIEAFGPYAEAVRVPFDNLARDGLFLIHGSTGSGKTYLLDALCFALYGEVSGERSVKGLRSDHAPAGAVPRVALEFSAADGRWRVERQPAHEAPKARGSGTTSRPAKAALWRLVGEGREPVAGNVTEVSREITRLVGLDAAQFRQVILLPQGRFAEVLRARDEEREALLKTLFDTTLYERAMGWLEDQARQARVGLAEQRRCLATWREQVWQAWEPWSEPDASIRADAAPQPDGPELDQAALEALGAAIATQEATARSDHEVAVRRFEQAQADLQACLTLTERWDRRQGARQRLQELERQDAAIAQLRLRLDLAERAEQLRPSLRAISEAREARNRAEQACQASLSVARHRRDGGQGLPDVVVAMDLLQPPDAGALTTALTSLAARRGELKRLVGLSQEAREAHTAQRQAAAAVEEGTARISRGLALVAAHQERRSQLEPRILAARSCRDALTGLAQAAAQARARTGLLEQLEAAQRQAVQATAAALSVEERQQRARRHQLDLRERQLAGMVARLAAGLQSGVPCPVCGSRTHPQPATAGKGAGAGQAVGEHSLDGSAPDGDALDGSALDGTVVDDQAVAAAEQDLEAAARALAEARGEQARCLARRQSLEEQVGPLEPDLAGAQRSAQAAAAAAENELAAARRQAEALPELELDDQKLGQELLTYEKRLEQLRLDGARDRERARSEAERARGLQERLTAELGEGQDPSRLLEDATELARALDHLARASQAWHGAVSREQEAGRRLAEDLLSAGFSDRATLEQALAEPDQRAGWQAEIQRHAEERLRQQGVLASLELQDVPQERPDPAAAYEARAQADARREAALERLTRAAGARQTISALVERHRQGEQQLRGLQTTADLINAVADRCWGRSQPHISLQRWILSAYLEEICGYANQRLALMSGGRYDLRLSDDSGQRRGSKAGLGLRVLDAFTGEEREVSSLSGGETFQASLALALGVADTVQAHSGGVRLEALFIDEGFGSLDADSLQLAMDELDRLREGGRMIGLISHVGTLRERIRSGIAVVATERGSQLDIGILEGP
ncbi:MULTISPECIES: AAA family ATPase [Aphanothece]|uniref:AAA family ATPase n=1 Tax=Aphanothece TaxID=1121 RepID=UPI003984C560